MQDLSHDLWNDVSEIKLTFRKSNVGNSGQKLRKKADIRVFWASPKILDFFRGFEFKTTCWIHGLLEAFHSP